jgi:NAD-dependent dihydropyrimidine dehydrogenase PreA subunit
MTYVVTDGCIDCKDMACVEECPVDCIYEGALKTYIHPVECIDCGLCAEVCPYDAVFLARAVPQDQRGHLDDAAAFFDVPLPGRDGPLGSPGGSMKLGPVGVDTPFVQARRAS